MMKFYKCSHCGNIIAFVDNKGVPVKCCGEKMEEIVANTVDAAKEKHVPVIKVDGNLVTVTVGDVAHPMLAEHSILWVALETKQGAQRKELAVGSEPTVQFALVDGDEVKAAYAYCNLHGLWKAEA
jgi:superoxide reductase